MNLNEARSRFIEAWGRLGVEWGVNRTMAQIHALLLLSPLPLDTDAIIDVLQISRGNASQNLRALLDWGLIHKELRPGVRRDFFRAEKDAWEMARCIAAQRRKKELDPLLRLLDEVADLEPEAPGDARKVRELQALLAEIRALAGKADDLIRQALARPR